MCLFKRRPNISKSDGAERGIIVTGTGKVTFPELDPQLVQTEEAVWCYPSYEHVYQHNLVLCTEVYFCLSFVSIPKEQWKQD